MSNLPTRHDPPPGAMPTTPAGRAAKRDARQILLAKVRARRLLLFDRRPVGATPPDSRPAGDDSGR